MKAYVDTVSPAAFPAETFISYFVLCFNPVSVYDFTYPCAHAVEAISPCGLYSYHFTEQNIIVRNEGGRENQNC